MSMFRSLLPLFARPKNRRECERDYLNQAVSLYDLERRERDIAQGLFAGQRRLRGKLRFISTGTPPRCGDSTAG